MSKKVAVKKEYYYSSEDDDLWESEEGTLINTLSFGWTEDGRCGYLRDDSEIVQACPRAIDTFELAKPKLEKKAAHTMALLYANNKGPLQRQAVNTPQFICKSASAGSRHTLFLMIDCSINSDKRDRLEARQKKLDFELQRRKKKKPVSDIKVDKKEKEDDDELRDRIMRSIIIEENEPLMPKKRLRKVMISGLSQVGLCEESGVDTPVDIPWDSSYDRPVGVAAGRGTSFIYTKNGHVYSFGFGKWGMLGHGDEESIRVPKRILSLARIFVTKISAGSFHIVAKTEFHELYSWGRNNKGQLGLGMEGEPIFTPKKVIFPPQAGDSPVADVCCGFEHTICLIHKSVPDPVYPEKSIIKTIVFAWGDESRGQLGSGDFEYRARPQENRYLSRYCDEMDFSIDKIAAGGFHNLALVRHSGQVISWGAGDYGQLGHGTQFDDPRPKMINNLEHAYDISAGLRHSLAVCGNRTVDVMAWGYNGYGELGLGDLAIRLSPVRLSSFRNSRVKSVVCGERHSVVLTSHKPMKVKEASYLKPYFDILEAEVGNKAIMRGLKFKLAKEGEDPRLLDAPDAMLPGQTGMVRGESKNDRYEAGLRYCMDTKFDEFDWRRKAMEACFECVLPHQILRKVCLSCSRNCLHMYRLRPYIRQRQPGDTCDCRTSGLCVSKWNFIRDQFDKVCDESDTFIGPRKVRSLLKALRYPYPVETADVDDCLALLAEGKEDEDQPRIRPVAFERWYRKYYDEEEENDLQRGKTAELFK